MSSGVNNYLHLASYNHNHLKTILRITHRPECRETSGNFSSTVVKLKIPREKCVTTEKMAKAQPSSSKLFCFTGLLIPLGNNLFEEEESINYFEEKCVCYGFNKYYQIRFET